jgi:hypothetical protein
MPRPASNPEWPFTINFEIAPISTGDFAMPSASTLPTALIRALGSAIHAWLIAALACGQIAFAGTAVAADPPAEAAAESAGLSAAELEELVAPIALYPDELLAIVLPASTYPLQIVQGARYLDKRESDPELEPDEDWDPSVLGLLNYPEVVEKMNEDLDWTWKLGEAVADQQDEVMDAVQSFRAKADTAGNLGSNDKMEVKKETEGDKQVIVIESTSTEVIYVPVYQPSTVVVYSTTPYPYYYSPPYPYYYSPHAAFWTGMFVGAAVGYGMSWGHHHHGHSSIEVNRNINANVNVNKNQISSDRSRGQGGQEWKADKNRGKQSGARPGSKDGSRQRASAGSREAGAGARPSTQAKRAGPKTDRAGGAARPSDRSTSASRDRATSGQRDRAASGSRDRSASGRDLTTGSRSQTRSSNSSFGGYKSGSSARSQSSRGHASRGRSGGGSRGGGSRGGGSRGGRR